jgi:hypothetical protein
MRRGHSELILGTFASQLVQTAEHRLSGRLLDALALVIREFASRDHETGTSTGGEFLSQAYGRLPPAAVTSVPTTTAAATTTTAITASASSASFFPGPRFINRQSSAFEVLSVKHGNRLGGIGLGRHFNESKTSGPTRLSVLHEVDRSDRPGLREQILQIVLGRVVG